jgi:hypothetical protein
MKDQDIKIYAEKLLAQVPDITAKQRELVLRTSELSGGQAIQLHGLIQRLMLANRAVETPDYWQALDIAFGLLVPDGESH